MSSGPDQQSQLGDRVEITKTAEWPERWRFQLAVYRGSECIHTEDVRAKDLSGDIMDWLEADDERQW